jgi:hypothetical protein
MHLCCRGQDAKNQTVADTSMKYELHELSCCTVWSNKKPKAKYDQSSATTGTYELFPVLVFLVKLNQAYRRGAEC